MHPINRRDLMSLCAGAAAAGTLTQGPAAAAQMAPQGGTEPRFKKAVKLGMVGVDGDLTAKFMALKHAGFDGVELDSPNNHPLEAVLAAKQASGLEIPGVVDCVHWAKPFSDPDAKVREEGRKALETALRDCKAYGGTSVLVVPAVVKKNVPYWDAWARSQHELRQLLPLAAELQVQILIENVWNRFLLGPTELCRYVDELCSPWVGIHFDAGNLVQFGFPEHWVPILGTRIKKIDVKDYVRGKANYDGFQVELNEGQADWPSIVSALRTVGYRGWFTAEMRGGDEQYLQDLARRMDQFLAEPQKGQ